MSLFSHNAVGITINDHSIEVVALAKRGSSAAVKNAVRVALKPNIVQAGVIKDQEALTDAFKQALEQAKPRAIKPHDAVVALPHTYAYSHVLSVPKGDQKSYEQAIATHVAAAFPIPPEDTFFSYSVTEQPDSKNVTILVVATSKEVLTTWHAFFTSLHITPTFELGAWATYRTLALSDDVASICVVDMSDPVITISIFDHDVLRYSFSRLFTSDESLLTAVTQEVQDALNYGKDAIGQDVTTIALIAPPGDKGKLTKQLSTQLKLSVMDATSSIENNASARLTTIGLALRSTATTWDKTNPEITVKKARTLTTLQDTYVTDATSEPEDIETAIAAKNEAKRLKKQKVTFAVLVLIGVLALAGAYWFRTQEKKQRAQELADVTTQFTQTQSFDLSVPIAVNEQDYTDQRVTGRIATYTIDGVQDYDEAVARANTSVQKDVIDTERFWDTPINKPANTDDVAFPLDIQWLVYTKPEADKLLTDQIDTLNTSSISYALNQIVVTDIQASTDTDLYTLTATVTLSLNEQIATTASTSATLPLDTASGSAQTVADDDDTQKAVILETSTGFLNVRSGPGTTFERIGRASPSDAFTLLETSGDWYQIQFASATKGWVFSEFVKIQ